MRSRNFGIVLSAIAASLAVAAPAAEAAPVKVNYYSNFSEDASTGLTFAGTPFFSESVNDFNIDFSQPGPAGRPTSSETFAADFLGTIVVPSDGNYTFGFELVQNAGYLFLDDALVFGGPNGFGAGTLGATLTAGVHSLELQFGRTNTGGSAKVGFTVPADITFQSAVPEPASWAMMLSGFGFIGFVARRRRSAMGQAKAPAFA